MPSPSLPIVSRAPRCPAGLLTVAAANRLSRLRGKSHQTVRRRLEETLCGLWLPPGSRRGFLVYDRARVVAILARERADEAKVAALAKRAQADRRARERARLAAIPTGFVTLTELRQRIYGFAELSNRVLHRRLERELGKRNLRFGAGTPPRRLYRLDAVVASGARSSFTPGGRRLRGWRHYRRSAG